MTSKRSEGQIRYDKFHEAYREAHPELKRITQKEQADEEWSKLKNDENLRNQRLVELKAKALRSKASAKTNFLALFAKQAKKNVESQPSTSAAASNSTAQTVQSHDFDKKVEENDDEIGSTENVRGTPAQASASEARPCPAQDQNQQDIDNLKKKLISLKELRANPYGNSQASSADISKVEKEINEKEVRKRRLIRDANHKVKKRKQLKESIKEICDSDEKAAKILKTFNRDVTGRPRLV